MIYLVHHADAVDSDVDPQRPLSTAGRAHALALAAEAARPRRASGGDLAQREAAGAPDRRMRFAPSAIRLAEFAAIRGLQPTDPPSGFAIA